jgi:ABC-2 type transport system ATP-binding protein
MTAILTTDNIGKQIGKKTILSGINLNVFSGEIVGLIGANGAGKTTLFKIITGLTLPTRGYVRLAPGVSIGILPETQALIPTVTGFRYLQSLASIRNKIDTRQIKETMLRVGLKPNNPIRTSAYSLGMKQRLMLAQCIMEKPELILLDEPTNGLDPMGIIELRRLLRELAKTGTAILIASHLLREIEYMCDRVILLQNGQIIYETRLHDPKPGYVKLTLASMSDVKKVLHCLDSPPYELDDSLHPIQIIVKINKPIPDLLRELVGYGVDIWSATEATISLEQIFLEIMERQETPDAFITV